MSTDKIEKHVDLKASLARVWRALSDSTEFGEWFGVKLTAPFVAGTVVRGNITSQGYEHVTAELHIDQVDEAARIFAFRWHPFAIDPAVDYSSEPMTVVRFALTETPRGTHLEITETGFDALPAARRPRAFASNGEGWTKQAQNLTDHLAKVS
jgi:uncharacterized protein YndB with AHSA1/START domain